MTGREEGKNDKKARQTSKRTPHAPRGLIRSFKGGIKKKMTYNETWEQFEGEEGLTGQKMSKGNERYRGPHGRIGRDTDIVSSGNKENKGKDGGIEEDESAQKGW